MISLSRSPQTSLGNFRPLSLPGVAAHPGPLRSRAARAARAAHTARANNIQSATRARGPRTASATTAKYSAESRIIMLSDRLMFKFRIGRRGAGSRALAAVTLDLSRINRGAARLAQGGSSAARRGACGERRGPAPTTAPAASAAAPPAARYTTHTSQPAPSDQRHVHTPLGRIMRPS